MTIPPNFFPLPPPGEENPERTLLDEFRALIHDIHAEREAMRRGMEELASLLQQVRGVIEEHQEAQREAQHVEDLLQANPPPAPTPDERRQAQEEVERIKSRIQEQRERWRRQLETMPKVTIYLERSDDQWVPVTLNGVTVWIPPNTEVKVPEAIAEVIRESQRAEAEAAQRRRVMAQIASMGLDELQKRGYNDPYEALNALLEEVK